MTRAALDTLASEFALGTMQDRVLALERSRRALRDVLGETRFAEYQMYREHWVIDAQMVK